MVEMGEMKGKSEHFASCLDKILSEYDGAP